MGVDIRIVIRHLVGSKTTQIEQFPIEKFPELTIGREPGATILFDSTRDDRVSRKHAVIRVESGDPLAFKLLDLGSSNGTFLNGERIAAETELLPGDTIELGLGGPKFVFDAEPRPANLVARTRIMSAAGSVPTRVIDVAEAPPPAPTFVPTPRETKPSIGRNTVMRLLSDQRRTTSRVAIYMVAGMLVVIGAVGGAVYYTSYDQSARLAADLQREADEVKSQVDKQRAQQEDENQKLLAQLQKQQANLGSDARQIVERFGDATVLIQSQWRLYDRQTGKPVYHKRITLKHIHLPAYVMLPDGMIVRWLTTEDEERTNKQVGVSETGSGFVVGAQGFILTNKHVAAPWTVAYEMKSYEDVGLLYKLPANSKEKIVQTIVKPSSDPRFEKLRDWIPDKGGIVFESKYPVPIGESDHLFEGRNEVLNIQFPGASNTTTFAAKLERTSIRADTALIKIDAPQPLKTVELADGDNVNVGEKVIVLGYPGISETEYKVTPTQEANIADKKIEEIADPTVTDGIIAKITHGIQQEGGSTTTSAMGHVYQLTILATGAGNSGGPVFNKEAKVIGLFTYSRTGEGDERVTFAVPILYGRQLMQVQKTAF
jgi:serine protease Do